MIRSIFPFCFKAGTLPVKGAFLSDLGKRESSAHPEPSPGTAEISCTGDLSLFPQGAAGLESPFQRGLFSSEMTPEVLLSLAGLDHDSHKGNLLHQLNLLLLFGTAGSCPNFSAGLVLPLLPLQILPRRKARRGWGSDFGLIV